MTTKPPTAIPPEVRAILERGRDNHAKSLATAVRAADRARAWTVYCQAAYLYYLDWLATGVEPERDFPTYDPQP